MICLCWFRQGVDALFGVAAAAGEATDSLLPGERPLGCVAFAVAWRGRGGGGERGDAFSLSLALWCVCARVSVVVFFYCSVRCSAVAAEKWPVTHSHSCRGCCSGAKVKKQQQQKQTPAPSCSWYCKIVQQSKFKYSTIRHRTH